MLQPVHKQSLSDAVFEQLRDRILSGEMAPGSALPAERLLCEALGVNRGAVREALKRLEQARLVSVRHGGSSQVLDYHQSSGLDLLPALLISPSGAIDLAVVRSIVEMRSALAIDIARLAAQRGGTPAAAQLDAIVLDMREAGDDLSLLQQHAMAFWEVLVDASGNIAYQLAYNSLRQTYDRCRELLRDVLAVELRDVDSCAAVAAAVGSGDAGTAETRARALVRRGEAGIKEALRKLDDAKRGQK
jgi:DNA-binding FadR family transcriptional regulator